MTTIAHKVKATITTQCPTTFSLYAGYGYGQDNLTVRFQGGVLLMEKHNKDGRCTSAKYIYADDSTLDYRFKGDGKYTLTAKEKQNDYR